MHKDAQKSAAKGPGTSGIRFPPKLRAALEAEAKASKRTFAGYVKLVLEEHLEAKGYKLGDAE